MAYAGDGTAENPILLEAALPSPVKLLRLCKPINQIMVA